MIPLSRNILTLNTKFYFEADLQKHYSVKRGMQGFRQ